MKKIYNHIKPSEDLMPERIPNTDFSFSADTGATQAFFRRIILMFFLSGMFIFAGITKSSAQYCTPPNSSSPCWSSFTNIQILGTTLNNSSTCNNGASYDNYAPSGSTTASLTVGTQYTISFTNTASNNNTKIYRTLFMDVNQDGDFDDAGEKLVGDNYGQDSNSQPVNVNFTVPAGATPGQTRIRVREDIQKTYANAPCVRLSNGETEDYTVTIVSITPCSGTPAPGNTQSTLSSVCASDNFTLSFSNDLSSYTGLTYQWQSSPDGVTYSNISGATNITRTTTQSSATYYRCAVTCANSGLTGNSTDLQVNQNSFLSCYCTPPANTSSTCTNQWITNVGITGTTLSNPSACSAPFISYPASGATTATLTAGNTYTLNLSNYTSNVNSVITWCVWIDADQDGIFENTGGEKVLDDYEIAGAGPNTPSITVPAGATAGQTKMRVRMDYNGGNDIVNPCTALQRGETEDYTITIVNTAPCTGTPAPGTTQSTLSSVCSSENFTLSFSNDLSASTGLTYQWQSSPDGGVYSDISGATSLTYTTTQTAATYYRCAVTCTNSGNTGNSTGLQVTQNGFLSCYCTPGANTNTSCSSIYITGVNITGTTLNNTSACSAPFISYPASGATTATLTAGVPYTINLSNYTSNVNLTITWCVWIDANQNGLFESPSEKVVDNYEITGAGPNARTITIPVSALAGQTHLRVRADYNGGNPINDPCSQLSNGETEDYTVTITTDCPDMIGGTASPAYSIICPSGLQTQTLTTDGSGGILQWQKSTDNATWSDISGATNNSYTTPNGNTPPFSGQGSTVYFRCMVSNTNCFNVSSSTAKVVVSQPNIPVTVAGKTSSSITLNWTPINGSTNYDISYTGVPNGSSNNVTPPYTISGLNPGNAYNITVTQTGLSCSASGTLTGEKTLCASPTNVVVSSAGNRRLKVDWEGAAGDYRVYYRPTFVQTGYQTKDVTTAGTTGTTTINVSYNTSYEAYVVAKDCPSSGLYGQPSALAYGIVGNSSPCTPTPTIHYVKSTCAGQIEVSMSGSPTGKYSVAVQRLTPTVASMYRYTVTGSYFQVNVNSPGQTFLVAVASKCVSGTSDYVVYSGGITIKPLCNAITNLILSHATCNGFTASWNRDPCTENTVNTYNVFIRRTSPRPQLTWNSYVVASPNPPITPNKLINWMDRGSTIQCYVRSNYVCSGYIIQGPPSTTESITTLSIGCREEDESLIQPEAPAAVITSADNMEAISLYPNPNGGQFRIDISRLSNEKAEVRIEVMNMLGQTILTDISEAKDGFGNELITLPETVSAGTYFVRVTVGNNVYTTKVNVSK